MGRRDSIDLLEIDMTTKCDEARLQSWENGEYVAITNVRGTQLDNAHWGWVRGFNEGFDAASRADISRFIAEVEAEMLENENITSVLGLAADLALIMQTVKSRLFGE